MMTISVYDKVVCRLLLHVLRILVPLVVMVLVITPSITTATTTTVEATTTSTTTESTTDTTTTSTSSSKLLSWMDCHVFLAPSKIPEFGYGVFAGRNYEKGEIVELAPLIIPLQPKSPIVQHTVVDDYVYGYYRVNMEKKELQLYNAIIFGYTMYVNHQENDELVNLKFTTYSREPVPGVPNLENASNSLGFIATRPIQAGEELFTSYYQQYGNSKQWFHDRQIELLEIESISKTQYTPDNNELDTIKELHCSKIYSGLGTPTWKKGVLNIIPSTVKVPFFMNHESRLHPTIDAGLGNVISKEVTIKMGERIEISSVLILSKQYIQSTPLSPLGIYYTDLDRIEQQKIQKLYISGAFIVQYQDATNTDWLPINNFTTYQDLVLLPAAGSIGLVQRVGNVVGNSKSKRSVGQNDDDKDGNCRVVIHEPQAAAATAATDATAGATTTTTSSGITIELVATKQIHVGEILQIDNLPPFGQGGLGSAIGGGSSRTEGGEEEEEEKAAAKRQRRRKHEQQLLLRELQLTGQTYYTHDLFQFDQDHYEEDEVDYDNDKQKQQHAEYDEL